MRSIGGDTASIYGEISNRGFVTLGERISLGPDDIFVDCGSGLGKTVLQAARDFGVRASYGVEYAGSRHAKAVANLERSDSAVAGRVRLLQGDCADDALWSAGGPLASCTCAYACNILFDDALNARLARCFEACPSIQRVAVLRMLPAELEGFREPYEVRCDTSWSAPIKVFGVEVAMGSSVFVYERGASLLPKWFSGELQGAALALAFAVVWSYVSGGAGG